MYRHAFRVLAQRAPVATAAAATALVVAPPSRCDWWSSKKPSAPAPAAAAAPPVVEPKTGVQFPAEQGGLKLAGCGVRVCVEIRILWRVPESSRRPPRHRRDACSIAWRWWFLTARRSQHGRVIAEK